MTVENRVSSIESSYMGYLFRNRCTSFMMENMYFNNECRQRVKDILTNRITVSDALAELNKKYGVSENQNES